MDRNYQQAQLVNGVQKSLSARRAWIEMALSEQPQSGSTVALRKESVDRNAGLWACGPRTCQSLSARRAWIEIVWAGKTTGPGHVALRKESVDRNARIGYLGQGEQRVALRKESVDRNILVRVARVELYCRSPQGERG